MAMVLPTEYGNILRSSDQIAVESTIMEIRKDFINGEENELIKKDASKRYLVWREDTLERYKNAKNFTCELKEVRSGQKLICESDFWITYSIDLNVDSSILLSKKVDGDRIFFCGTLGGELSYKTGLRATIFSDGISQGIKNPRIPVTNAIISDKRDGACN